MTTQSPLQPRQQAPVGLNPFVLGEVALAEIRRAAALDTERERLSWLWDRRAGGPDRGVWCQGCSAVRGFSLSRHRAAYACERCGTHLHPTSGTLFHGSSTPLGAWLRAAERLRGPAELRPNATELAQHLGLPYATARRIRLRILGEESSLVTSVPTTGQPATSDSDQPGGSESRDDLLRAAAECLADRGFEGTRVRDIADRAGVSPAAVLYHFDTRERVLVLALAWANARAGQRRVEAVAAAPGPGEQLAALVELSIPSDPEIRREQILWNELFTRSARGQLMGADLDQVAAYRELYASVIQQGLRSGVFLCPPGESDDRTESLLALIDGLSTASLIGRDWMPLPRMRALIERAVQSHFGVKIRLNTSGRLHDSE